MKAFPHLHETSELTKPPAVVELLSSLLSLITFLEMKFISHIGASFLEFPTNRRTRFDPITATPRISQMEKKEHKLLEFK